MAIIDRAPWHYDGEYPKNLPIVNGGTHIGMFLAWIVSRGLCSQHIIQCLGNRIQQLTAREITGRTLLFEDLDEKLSDELLSQQGLAFVRDYYDTNAYLMDYEAVLGAGLPSTYHVADTWDNYDRLSSVLNERYDRWLQGDLPPVQTRTPNAVSAEFEVAFSRYSDVMGRAVSLLPSESHRAIEVLEAFIAQEAHASVRAMMQQELSSLKIRQQ